MAVRTWNAVFKWLDVHVNAFNCINSLFDFVNNFRGKTNKRRVIEAVIGILFGFSIGFGMIWFLKDVR